MKFYKEVNSAGSVFTCSLFVLGFYLFLSKGYTLFWSDKVNNKLNPNKPTRPKRKQEHTA